MTFETTEAAAGISVEGTPANRITFATPGTYELMFSAQRYHASTAISAVVELYGYSDAADAELAPVPAVILTVLPVR